LVIFDCDGVLVDSEPLVNRIESECLAEIGVLVSPARTRALFKGKDTQGVIDGIAALRRGEPPPARWLYDLGLRTAVALANELQPVAGVREVVQQLWQCKHPICVASQSPTPRVRLSLRVTGLQDYFGKDVYTASMVARPKPAPDLFLYAAASCAPGTPASRCVVIEDSPSGISAARAAGMTVLGYCADEPAEALRAAGADALFDDMADLLALLVETQR
jgi:HAD superfamily hydrolase (TIGR01509 family)